MNGMDTGIFSPDTNITRGQLVTVLYRLADEPQVQTNAPFTDVSEGSYYAKAVAWAYGSGIAEGVTKERFAPQCVCNQRADGGLLRSLCPPEWQDRRSNRRSA